MDALRQYAEATFFLAMMMYGVAGLMYVSWAGIKAVADWWWNCDEPFDVFED